MSGDVPRAHRQFRRVEALYRDAGNPGWYRADLGKITPFITVPVWVYPTYAPFEANLAGTSSDEYVVLVDNTYVGSTAFNLAKIELAALISPEEENYNELMIGNIKKLLAEQRYYLTGAPDSVQHLLEYLIEYNGRNRALDARLRGVSGGPEFLHLLASAPTLLLLLHEVGHIAYGIDDYRFRQREVIDRHIAAVVGADHGLERLEEKAFCDLFALVNTIATLNKSAGWDPDELAGVCLHVLLGALLCIKARDLARAPARHATPASLDPARDILMARFEVAAGAVRESLRFERQWFDPTRRSIPFSGDRIDLRKLWSEALGMPVLRPETRSIASILGHAFTHPDSGGFEFVANRLNHIVPLSQFAPGRDGSDLDPHQA